MSRLLTSFTLMASVAGVLLFGAVLLTGFADEEKTKEKATATVNLTYLMPVQKGTCFTIRMEEFNPFWMLARGDGKEPEPDPNAEPKYIFDLIMKVTDITEKGELATATIECVEVKWVKGENKDTQKPLPFKIENVRYKNGKIQPGASLTKKWTNPKNNKLEWWPRAEEISYEETWAGATPWPLRFGLMAPDGSKAEEKGPIVLAKPGNSEVLQSTIKLWDKVPGFKVISELRERDKRSGPDVVQYWANGAFWWSQTEYYDQGRFLVARCKLIAIEQPDLMAIEPARN